ncbi:MAG TPA: hypothetical protein PLX39_17280 [Pyrinomonadaceae bacterium]|nr:hypothetical protein [Pyrinomonadaceae bacterium]
MANVKTVLRADCYVGGRLRKAGEEVELPESIAVDFAAPDEAPEPEKAEPKAEKKK